MPGWLFWKARVLCEGNQRKTGESSPAKGCALKLLVLKAFATKPLKVEALEGTYSQGRSMSR